MLLATAGLQNLRVACHVAVNTYTASTNQLFTTHIGINEDTESENTFAHH
jgi:hypothetical protein